MKGIQSISDEFLFLSSQIIFFKAKQKLLSDFQRLLSFFHSFWSLRFTPIKKAFQFNVYVKMQKFNDFILFHRFFSSTLGHAGSFSLDLFIKFKQWFAFNTKSFYRYQYGCKIFIALIK